MENESIKVLVLSPHEGTHRGIYIDDPAVKQVAIAAAHLQKPTHLLNVVNVQASLTPTDEEQMKQLFPQEPPRSEPPPVQQEPPKPIPPAPPPIRTKNVDVAKETEAKPVGV